jgi:hypothetical protein
MSAFWDPRLELELRRCLTGFTDSPTGKQYGKLEVKIITPGSETHDLGGPGAMICQRIPIVLRFLGLPRRGLTIVLVVATAWELHCRYYDETIKEALEQKLQSIATWQSLQYVPDVR